MIKNTKRVMLKQAFKVKFSAFLGGEPFLYSIGSTKRTDCERRLKMNLISQALACHVTA